MTATIVILILILAVVLMLVEIFFIPGVGIPGIVGVGLLLLGLFLSYKISTGFGHSTVAVTALVSVGLFVLAFRAKTWDKLSLKSDIEAKVEDQTLGLKVGDEGTAVSRLNPMGKALFNDQFVEATSKGEYIDEHATIEIVNIEGNKITVIKKSS